MSPCRLSGYLCRKIPSQTFQIFPILAFHFTILAKCTRRHPVFHPEDPCERCRASEAEILGDSRDRFHRVLGKQMRGSLQTKPQDELIQSFTGDECENPVKVERREAGLPRDFLQTHGLSQVGVDVILSPVYAAEVFFFVGFGHRGPCGECLKKKKKKIKGCRLKKF